MTAVGGRADGIVVEGLTKRYGGRPVLQDVSFRCPAGRVTGLIGPNGAGKSTTLRSIMGLVTPDQGRALVAGDVYRRLPDPLRTVGAVLDASAMHPGRRVDEMLTLARVAAGQAPTRVPELRELVGIGGLGGRRVGSLSLGQRQRLALAMALIGEPEVLVLDEPVNGLDPEGIAWIRDLVRDFAAGGGTVLLSSHLLAELSEVAESYVVIAGGRVVRTLDVEDLSATAAVAVVTPEPEQVAALLVGQGVVVEVDGDRVVAAIAKARAEALVLEARVPVYGFVEVARGADLESIYLEAIRGERGADDSERAVGTGAVGVVRAAGPAVSGRILVEGRR